MVAFGAKKAVLQLCVSQSCAVDLGRIQKHKPIRFATIAKQLFPPNSHPVVATRSAEHYQHLIVWFGTTTFHYALDEIEKKRSRELWHISLAFTSWMNNGLLTHTRLRSHAIFIRRINCFKSVLSGSLWNTAARALFIDSEIRFHDSSSGTRAAGSDWCPARVNKYLLVNEELQVPCWPSHSLINADQTVRVIAFWKLRRRSPLRLRRPVVDFT